MCLPSLDFDRGRCIIKRKLNRITLSLLTVFVLAAQALGSGGFYSYVDENGVRVFTNLGISRQAAPAPVEPTVPEAGANFLPLIQEYSRQHGVDEDLVKAIIQVESAFNPRAVSIKNCKGLMQLHPDTARRFGVEDVFDPAQNIEGGVKFLSHLIQSFGQDLDHVLAAYNAGENAVKRHAGIPPYRETTDYVAKVRALYGKELEEPEPPRRPHRILRMVEPDGTVVLTNVATQTR